MTGSLQEKYGTYYAVLSYKDKNKKNKNKWIPTGYEIKGNKNKAKAKLDELIEQYRHLEYNEADASRILFTTAIKQWLAERQGKVERSTYEGDEIYVNKHIIPYFEPKNLYLQDITPKHIKDYYEYKYRNGRIDGKGGLNVQSIKKHSAILKQVFTDALISEQITRNPAANVPLPKRDKQHQRRRGIYLTGEEANVMLRAFAGHELQAMVYVTLYYGLRRSEALGLRWQSVNFEENTLTIEHTVVKMKSIEYKDRTKTDASNYTFPLLPEVKEVLLRLKDQQSKNRETFGDTYIESDYIFVWQDGKLYRPDYITRTFQRVLAKHGFPKMRYHDLRHSTAGILHDKDWDLKDIQEWLRHADIEVTGNIYTQISEQRKMANAINLEKTFTI
jgi:integrase